MNGVHDDVDLIKDRVSDLVEISMRHEADNKEKLVEISPILSAVTQCKDAVTKLSSNLGGRKSSSQVKLFIRNQPHGG